jgi:cysteine synthase A
MSIERRKLLSAYGAKLVLTPAKEGMNGSIKKAKELNQEIKGSVILGQFDNPNNPLAHELTTAKEILKDMDKKIDIFVSVVGTGGTISGVAKGLKKELKDLKVYAVEPKESAVISGEDASPHKIQGIGAGFIPKNLDITIFDEVIKVSSDDAIKTAKELAKNEGLLVGISSGANVYAAKEVAKKYPNKNIVTILCDTGERYLSTELFE